MQKGFSLIEIALVMVIIGLLIGGVLQGTSIIENARNKDMIKSVQELTTAALAFKSQYRFMPGDLPNAATVINGIVGCNGNGNGQIDAGEQNCARDELIRAGFIRGVAGQPIRVQNSTLTLSSRLASGVPGVPVNWINVVVLAPSNCDVMVQLARSMGDGAAQGNAIWTEVPCPAQNVSTAVPTTAIRIN